MRASAHKPTSFVLNLDTTHFVLLSFSNSIDHDDQDNAKAFFGGGSDRDPVRTVMVQRPLGEGAKIFSSKRPFRKSTTHLFFHHVALYDDQGRDHRRTHSDSLGLGVAILELVTT